jgi:rhamnogalacturonan endolyase
MRRGFCVAGIVLLGFVAAATGAEKLDRGLVALEREDGSVFLSWRLLEGDPADIVFRLDSTSGGLARTTMSTGTSIVDEAPHGKDAVYKLRRHPVRDGRGAAPVLGTATIRLSGKPKPYISIPLQGNHDFQKVGIGDLDGDGTYEYVIKQPNFNTDPYQQPGYWKKSNTTYKLEAYRLDGTMLWRHDMGWSIEAGVWYSPWIVYDVDGNGKAEVYCKAGEGDPRDEKGLVQTGPEYLIKLDGETGKVVAKTDWPSRDGFTKYNYYCRNFLTVAYLDGRKPSLVIQRGTYNLIKMQALDKDFNQIWYWESTQEEMGHPDIMYVADIDTSNPGLEIFYGIEPRQKTDAICVVDAKTGRKLWAHKKPTRHVHGQGMAADVLADSPGMEVYAGERDLKQRWLYSAEGKLIEFHESGTLSPRALWWDADPQKEVVVSGAVRNWGGEPMQRLEGRVIAVVDCLGDYREEVITALKGELRIYTTTIPTSDRHVCLMQDHQYRMGVVAQTMGYYYPAQLGK